MLMPAAAQLDPVDQAYYHRIIDTQSTAAIRSVSSLLPAVGCAFDCCTDVSADTVPESADGQSGTHTRAAEHASEQSIIPLAPRRPPLKQVSVFIVNDG